MHHALTSAALLALFAWSVAAGGGGRSSSPAAPTGGVRGVVALDGTVSYAGAPAEAQVIDMSADPYCAAAQQGTPPTTRPIETDAQGHLRDAIVHVKQGVTAQRSAVPSEPAVLDQRACIYQPSVVALRAGQPLMIRNSDATLHNVHVRAEANRGFNLGQPIRGLEAKRTFQQPEVGIHVACDIHGWMNGTIAVFDHPYFAVTGADGRFSLDGLPPGEYVVEVWHATLGTLSQKVTVAAGAQSTTTFTFGGG